MRKGWPKAKGGSLGERVHELRERVRELEEWNDGTLSNRDKNTRGVGSKGLPKTNQVWQILT